MNTLLFLLIGAFPLWAQNILIKAPEASPSGYQRFLREHPDLLSFSDYIQQQIQNQPAQEENLLQRSDSFLENPRETLDEMRKEHQKSPLTLTSLRFVRDLSLRLLEEKTLLSSSSEFKRRRDLMQIACRSIWLLQEGDSTSACPSQLFYGNRFQKEHPWFEEVILETVRRPLSSSLRLAARTPHHWTFLSNEGPPATFFGTVEQVGQQHFTKKSWVTGSCEKFKVQDFPLELQSQSQVYFSDDCVQSLETPKHWLRQQKTWWIFAGVLAAGIVVTTLQNKQITLSSSLIQW
ncbi:MAG: hypothetical protein AAGB31_05995 [Bdellovibrio sp.]